MWAPHWFSNLLLRKSSKWARTSNLGAHNHIRRGIEKAAPHAQAGVRCAPWVIPCLDDAHSSAHADERSGEPAFRLRLLGRGLCLPLRPAGGPRLYAAGAAEYRDPAHPAVETRSQGLRLPRDSV